MRPENKLHVLLSLITPDTDYQLEQAAIAERVAAKLGIALNVEFADGDGVYQTLQILKIIQSEPELRPNAVIVEPAGTSMVQVAQAAMAANIAWVILNRDADYLGTLRSKASVPIFGVSTDNQAVGRIQGEQMNVLTPADGCVLYLEGPSSSDTARYRTKGMLVAKRKDIGLKHLRGGWTEAGAYHAVQSWLRLGSGKGTRIDAVICQNDTMAIGARRAFEELRDRDQRQRFLALPFTGCDGVPEKGQTYVQRGLLKATVINPPLTGAALEMLDLAFRSNSQPPEQTLVTPKSYPPIAKLESPSNAELKSFSATPAHK